MALFLGTLEYVLEEGPRHDWFEDSTIALAAVVSASAAVIFFARVLMAFQPIVDLRAFSDRNFAFGSMFSFVLGIGLYGLTYLFPVFLGEIRGYNALMIGKTMFVSGATMFLSAPIVGRLMTRTDPRLMLAAGFAIVALSNWQMSYVTKDWDYWELFLPQVLRGFGMMLAIVPITSISLGTLAPDVLKNALRAVQPHPQSRRRGGSRRPQHRTRQAHRPAPGAAARGRHLGAAARRSRRSTASPPASGGSDAQGMALKQLFMFTRVQGAVMAFADVFLLLALMFLALCSAGLAHAPAAAYDGGGGRALKTRRRHSINQPAVCRNLPRSASG